MKVVIEDMDLRRFIQRHSGITAVVDFVVGDGRVVTAPVQHDSVVSIVMDKISINDHMITTLRRDFKRPPGGSNK